MYVLHDHIHNACSHGKHIIINGSCDYEGVATPIATTSHITNAWFFMLQCQKLYKICCKSLMCLHDKVFNIL
jgi:hypothetical protein